MILIFIYIFTINTFVHRNAANAIQWLTDWLTGWLTDWLTDWLTGWLTDWLTHWLTGWLTDWLTGWLEWIVAVGRWVRNWSWKYSRNLFPVVPSLQLATALTPSVAIELDVSAAGHTLPPWPSPPIHPPTAILTSFPPQSRWIDQRPIY